MSTATESQTEVPAITPTDSKTTNEEQGQRNGYSQNGFSGETVEAVRNATEKFFIENFSKPRGEAKKRAELLTAGWALDLELTED